MKQFDRHQHWENIHKTKESTEVGWYQPIPFTSLEFIKKFEVPLSAKIIDIGGGDSFFVDHLLELGYQEISVLDISESAIEKAKARLGEKATNVKWIVADVTSFQPNEQYDFWHDRAAFHFLLEKSEIESYIKTAQLGLKPEGILVIGTFSENGPTKCSGIEIRQYSEHTMTNILASDFEKIGCVIVDHVTPSWMIQNYIFCSFRKSPIS